MLERKWKKSGDPNDHQLYLDSIHVFSHLVQKEKSRYYTKQLSTADTKTVFKTVNTLLNRNVPALPYMDSSKDLSDRFSKYFADKIVNIRNIIDSTKFDDVPLSIPVLNHSVPMFSEFKPADQEEVRKNNFKITQ